MRHIKNARELLPLIREARQTGADVKVSISGPVMEQILDALHLRQAAGRNPNVRKLAEELFEMKYMNQLQSLDIQDYVACIHSMTGGGSPCEWCEDRKECQRAVKGTTGCTEWWLRFREGRQ